MISSSMWLFLVIAYWQGDPLSQARAAFLAGDYDTAITIAKPLVADYNGEAMLLTADAHFAIGTPKSMKWAIYLYERCIYEDPTIPFPDHSYHQLAAIYTAKSLEARERGETYEAREMSAEAEFYLGQMLKKYPNSFYRDRALNSLIDLSMADHDYEKVRSYADMVWNRSTNPNLLVKVEPIIFIHQDPFDEPLARIEDTYNRHSEFIRSSRNLLLEYAKRFEEAGDLARASEMFLLVYNLWPTWGDSATSLRRLADLHQRQGEWNDAAFLYRLIMRENPNTPAEAGAWLGVAQMMEKGQISTFKLDDARVLNYRDLVNRIRLSSLDPATKARYSFILAQYESLMNVEKALLILRSLNADYDRGPYVFLYKNFYKQLLFTTIDRNYNMGDDWALDRIYRQHQKFLSQVRETAYPHRIARAYLRLDLPSSALQVYEAMWNVKDTLAGFDLAYEEPLTDYLELLNKMQHDFKLKFRLTDYANLYSSRDRFPDRYLYVKTMYESRNMTKEEFLERVKELPTDLRTIYDAKRLRRMSITVQEAVLDEERKDAANRNTALYTELNQLTDSYYAKALSWRPLKQELPVLWREARLYQADRFFGLGNYYEAERRYTGILSNMEYDEPDRDWAYLQLARLHELKGEVTTSIRIYGQIAYAESEHSQSLAAFAKQRLFAIASEKKLKDQELRLGQL